MIKRFLSKIFSNDQLFDVLPSALINQEGILVSSNAMFKQYISQQTNGYLKDLLNIKTVDNQIIGSINGVNWRLIYKYYSSSEYKVWAIPEIQTEPRVWNTIKMPMIVISSTGRIKYANKAYTDAFPDFKLDDPVSKFCFAFDDRILTNNTMHEMIWGDSLCRVKVYQHSASMWLLTLENMTNPNLIDTKPKEANYLRAMGQLTSSVVHDFRNILSVINGYSELISDGCDAATTHNYMRQIKNTVNNASNMVNELLKFSRANNSLEVACSPYEVLSNLKSIIEQIVGPSIKVSMGFKEQNAKIGLSETDFERIITNLIMNAKDAIDLDGKISIQLTKKYFDKGWNINNCHIRSGFYVVINIDDTGHGINPSDQQKIFSPFFTTKRNGNGLGLSTILSILRDISGGMHLISRQNYGTRVSIYMPIVQAISKTTPKIALEELKTQSHMLLDKNIVMVEDNPDVLNICSLALAREGYRLKKFSNAEDAIQGINKDDSIDLLITDVNLPGMNGADMVSALNKKSNIQSVLVISGYDASALENKFPPKTKFLSKPIPLSELKDKVQRILTEQK